MPAGPSRYWHTIRHLKPIQLHGRLRFLLTRPVPDLRPAPPLRGLAVEGWISPARRTPSQTGPDRFRFLNETHALPEAGWDDPRLSRLWRYNLHYFDDLNAQGAAGRRHWHEPTIARWVAENPPGHGTGWEPYPTSLRIVNWIKWALAGNALASGVVDSLAVQTRWLTHRLEYHLLGNHLFANAKALVFAGAFFAGAEADSWLERGLAILAAEIPEQILPDGGHFELSPMYHSLVLEDMLDLVNLLRCAGSALNSARVAVTDWPRRIASMRDWLAAMTHPDGGIAFFNDAALGIAPSPRELESYASRLGLWPRPAPRAGVTWLRDSGYIRVTDDRAVLIVDAARTGPDHLSGHAHADTLSFELSLDGERVFVNSGTSEYGAGPERARQRGTTAHNTVAIAGQDSSEVWSGFRMARRASPRDIAVLCGEDTTIRAGHDGYERLYGQPIHHRAWQLGGGRLAVSDSLSGGSHAAIARFHLHPNVRVSAAAGGHSGVLTLVSGRTLTWDVLAGSGRIVRSRWHPAFGMTLPSHCLEIALDRSESRLVLSWHL